MGKTRDLFKKIRDTKGLFHAKMGTIKENLFKRIHFPQRDKKKYFQKKPKNQSYSDQFNLCLLDNLTIEARVQCSVPWTSRGH